MKNIFHLNSKFLPLWFLIFVAIIVGYGIFTRAQDLGYSNYQGDEINTVDFIYEMKNGPINYLFEQKRGPSQYLINMANVNLFGYINEFQIRLPYLIFGILSFISFFFLAKKLFGRAAGSFTLIILSLNGLFLAFARITQYQSLMYLVLTTAAFIFLLYIKDHKAKKFLYISGGLMSIALISHYDALSVLPFYLIIFFRQGWEEYQKTKNIKKSLIDGITFLSLMIVPALFFYIPFSFGSEFDNKTSDYLGDRLFGGGLMPRTGHITMLISMYIPTPVLHSFYFMAILTTLFFIKKLDVMRFKIKSINVEVKRLHVQIVYIGLILFNIIGSVFSLYPIKPRASTVLVLVSSVLLSLLLIFSFKVSKKYVATLVWALGCYSFYFFLMKDARTHVYVSMIPTMILAGLFLSQVYKILNRVGKFVFLITISTISILWAGYNWVIFVNKSPEYPWFDKNYLGNLVYELPRWRPKKIDGVFGFNNWRGWEIVKAEFDKGCLYGSYDSNEKNSITYFYMRKNQLRYENLLGYLPDGFNRGADNIILVEGPHSWEYLEAGYKEALKDYDLVNTIYSVGIPVTYIYSRSYDASCFD